MLMVEMDAAHHYGKLYDEWFSIDTEERALMIAHLQITRIMTALDEYDRSREWKPPK